MEKQRPILQKKSIEIEPLSTVKQILDRTGFLPYSTQLRNLAYQIQLFEFLRAIHKNYKIDRGLENIYTMQICYIASIIIEHLLFCGLLASGIEFNSRHKKATALNQKAKGLGMVSKELSRDIQDFIDIRNDFHPEKQSELHIKKSSKNQISLSVDVINKLGLSIKIFLKKKSARAPF